MNIIETYLLPTAYGGMGGAGAGGGEGGAIDAATMAGSRIGDNADLPAAAATHHPTRYGSATLNKHLAITPSYVRATADARNLASFFVYRTPVANDAHNRPLISRHSKRK